MSKKTKIAALFAAIVFCLVLIFFWLGGYDFNQRGEPAVFCGLIAITFSAVAFAATMATTD